MQIVLVSGLSGSGKKHRHRGAGRYRLLLRRQPAAAMLQPLVDYLTREGHRRIAIAIDARSRQVLRNCHDCHGTARAGCRPQGYFS